MRGFSPQPPSSRGSRISQAESSSEHTTAECVRSGVVKGHAAMIGKVVEMNGRQDEEKAGGGHDRWPCGSGEGRAAEIVHHGCGAHPQGAFHDPFFQE
ncbi:MAG: hypothetical protein MZV70_42425 [Desulfobacterales bacterium]|nr:hypothetical protein [Desulfobacterales bacterium]